MEKTWLLAPLARAAPRRRDVPADFHSHLLFSHAHPASLVGTQLLNAWTKESADGGTIGGMAAKLINCPAMFNQQVQSDDGKGTLNKLQLQYIYLKSR